MKARHILFSENLPTWKRWKVSAKVEGGYFEFVRHPFQDIESETVCKRLAEDDMGVLVLLGSFFRQDKGERTGIIINEEGVDR